MAEYMLFHTHEPEDCEKLFKAYESYDSPLKGKGRTFFCTCPSGEHGGFIQVEAADEREAVAMLPETHHPTTKVYGGETMSLDLG